MRYTGGNNRHIVYIYLAFRAVLITPESPEFSWEDFGQSGVRDESACECVPQDGWKSIAYRLSSESMRSVWLLVPSR